ncbi:MAG: M20 family metallopeptidase [Spirochaetes bacterium]|nr:M20 family metallopeptidase [Spirochaetota bacterium]
MTFALDAFEKMGTRVVEHRRALHRIPEIGLELPETIAYVEAKLAAAGAIPRRCGMGLVADFGSSGPLVAIRADMDGLPIVEETELPFASERHGRMHACGHDVHTAALLGCAEILAGTEPGFRVRLAFQPGEEGFFGAVGMIEGGCLDDVRAIVGGHVGDLSEELEPGQAGFMPGFLMAAADRFRAVFTGQGGHGAEPHRARDPIPALAEYILACQSFRAREFNQTEPVVISICRVESGSAHNIIPEQAFIEGTVRTLSDRNRELAERRLREIGEGIALATGTRFLFDWLGGYPPLVNHPGATAIARAAASSTLGPDRVVDMTKPSMGGEDFAYFLKRVPGCFWYMNTQAPALGIDKPNHNPRFDVDERRILELALVNLNAAAALADAVARGELG